MGILLLFWLLFCEFQESSRRVTSALRSTGQKKVYLRILLGCLVQYDKTVLQTHFGASPYPKSLSGVKGLILVNCLQDYDDDFEDDEDGDDEEASLDVQVCENKNLHVCIDCIIYLDS